MGIDHSHYSSSVDNTSEESINIVSLQLLQPTHSSLLRQGLYLARHWLLSPLKWLFARARRQWENPSLFSTLILPGKMTENTFSFIAMTWGIVTGKRREDEWANWKLRMIRWLWWYEGQIGNLVSRWNVQSLPSLWCLWLFTIRQALRGMIAGMSLDRTS